jgi:amino acid adenylation domain-containing protein
MALQAFDVSHQDLRPGFNAIEVQMTTVPDTRGVSDAGPLARRGDHIPELVAFRATESPNTVALTEEGRTLTFGELDARANRLAGHLRSLGVGADVLVGLCLPRSLDMVVGALGIMKAGGAYVPLDPAYPSDRLAFMLDDAQAPVLISIRGLAQRLPVAKREVVYVDALQTAGYPADSPPVRIAPDDLAYVIYTSGSTGHPKGVEITHGSLANLVSWHNQAFSVTDADRASQVAGLGFDAAVWELWPYLVAGASVHLADESTRNSAELLRDWLLAQRITIGFVPTPLAERLLSLNLKWPRQTSLRILLTGGDALHQYPPAGLPFLLVNNYGPTECTVVATSGPVPSNGFPNIPPPIGRAIANTQILLLDERLQPVPVGTPGEICIGGPSLARGYHNHPDLTAEKFIPNPFGAQPNGRLYKTGDLARLLPDGQLAFLGRIDDQIKIRGYRIEPGEISSALNRHQGISASLIVAREDTPGDKRLVAYLTQADDSELTHTGLRDFLRDSLPEYMLPAAFVRLEVFPLTPHGKIDRATLPLPDSTNTLQDEVSVGPVTETERRVAGILGELLALDEIGLDDNFFMLGGHSLLGAQLIARLRNAFGVDLALRALFEAPTVAALSAEVDRLAGGKQAWDTPSQ